MLLLYQAGSVKIGEVVRYTVTYTPAEDRILPSPLTLHLKIKNTSTVALRAAFVHGPYALYTAAYPAAFNPNKKWEQPHIYGVPEFEPNLKAGGSFSTLLEVPEVVRSGAGAGRSRGRDGQGFENGGAVEEDSVSWIIEVASQVIFSSSAAVHYEILLGRDERSLNLGILGGTAPSPGSVSDFENLGRGAQPKGVYSRAIKVKVDDTAKLWNTPKMPEWKDEAKQKTEVEKGNKDVPLDGAMLEDEHPATTGPEKPKGKRQKKVHLVVLTHGLHSNLGADMLYLKESIDATAKQAKIDAKERRAKRRREQQVKTAGQGQGDDDEDVKEETRTASAENKDENMDEDDDEEVIVRGFSGNAARTERGIKYLGKRLAKFVLAMTYPDQPYRPITKTATQAFSHGIKPEASKSEPGTPTHSHSTIFKEPDRDRGLAYKITSISFIAHSLGGLVQTYAVAYIHKHSPTFFDYIKPINFISLASPFLGLSNENPLYVKFALDFGLVGRTGQDLGLTWRAPTIARSGWGAIVSGIGESAHKKIDGETAPEAKPLLRILPTGPAHIVLKKFRNRTVYSNVVNDGIVPLRTSCLLFLDWQGLGRVEKARRENGLVGTITEWGWAEITGQNSSSPGRRYGPWSADDASDPDENGGNTPTRQGHGADVPQPSANAAYDDDTPYVTSGNSGVGSPKASTSAPSSPVNTGPLAGFLGMFRPNTSQKQRNHVPKPMPKIYKRSQTIKVDDSSTPSLTTTEPSPIKERRKATTGEEHDKDPTPLSAPPQTTFFESAGDLLKPPLPSVEFLINPKTRLRTIFHDRVYHPSDIPPPPFKKRSSSNLLRGYSSPTTPTIFSPPLSPRIDHADSSLSSKYYDDTSTNRDKDSRDVIDGSAMKVEEKIARAYHRDLSWRKVLVRLEPDAHNNMIVRRMFANAYGWPVIKHLCDTHFSDSAVARLRDEDESSQERAKSSTEAPDVNGGETKDNHEGEDRPDTMIRKSDRVDSEIKEAADQVPALNATPKLGSLGKALASAKSIKRPGYDRADSVAWSDRDWDSGEDSDDIGSSTGYQNSVPVVQRPRSSSPGGEQAVAKSTGGWNWTEAIVGKGAGMGSPQVSSNMEEIERFLGISRSSGTKDVRSRNERRADGDLKLNSHTTKATVMDSEASRIGPGLAEPGERGVSEGLARLSVTRSASGSANESGSEHAKNI